MNEPRCDCALPAAIAAVTAATDALVAAIARDDFAAVDFLLAERGRHFAHLDRQVAASGAAELAHCRASLTQLARQNTALLERCVGLRDKLAAACRRAAALPSPHRDQATVLPVCLDRKV